MKSCSCGGSNENCRFCFGSGYVSESQGVPSLSERSDKYGLNAQADARAPMESETTVAKRLEANRKRDADRYATWIKKEKKDLLLSIVVWIALILTVVLIHAVIAH